MNKTDTLRRLRGLVDEIEASRQPWADEPKTLTPAEAFSALSDGLCLSQSNKLYESSVIKLDAEHGLVCWTREYHDDIGYRGRWFWDATSISGAVGYHVVPDPSQPADESAYAPAPTREELRAEAKRIKRQEEEKLRLEQQPTKPPLKVGDRVKRRWYATKDVGRVIEIDFTKGDEAIQIQWNEGVGAYPNDANLILVEAEPQVEYPLTFSEAMVAMENGAAVNSELHPSITYGPHRLGMEQRIFHHETAAKWRIVEVGGGK